MDLYCLAARCRPEPEDCCWSVAFDLCWEHRGHDVMGERPFDAGVAGRLLRCVVDVD